MGTPYRLHIGGALAAAFLVADEWTAGALETAGTRALGEAPAWLAALAKDVIRSFPAPPLERLGVLTRFIGGDRRIRDACSGFGRRLRVREWLVPPVAMGAARWPVPQIATVGDLATWLGLDPGTLAWLADARGLERLV